LTAVTKLTDWGWGGEQRRKRAERRKTLTQLSTKIKNKMVREYGNRSDKSRRTQDLRTGDHYS